MPQRPTVRGTVGFAGRSRGGSPGTRQSGGHSEARQRVWPESRKAESQDFRVRENPTAKDQRQKHRSPLGIAGGRYAPTAFLPPGIAGSFRGYAPRLEHQGPGFALKSSPVQTRCAPLAAASGFTLDPQSSPGTPPRSLAWQTGQTAGLSGRESARFVIAKYYVLRVRYSYLFATLTSENA